MHLGELKAKPVEELIGIAEGMGIENIARSKKQDVIFNILKSHSIGGEDIEGEGVLEILNDGFGIRCISEYRNMNYPTFLFWIFLLTAVLFLNIMYL